MCVSVCVCVCVCERAWEKGLIHTTTEIQFMPVCKSFTQALPRNIMHLTVDGQVCFHGWLFADAAEPRECISQSCGALIGMHGVPNCSQQQSWLSLWIISDSERNSTVAQVQMVALTRLQLPTRPRLPTPTRPTPIDSICVITGAETHEQA